MNEIGDAIHRFGIVPGQVLTVDQVKAMTLAVKAGQLKVDHFEQVAEITKSFNLVAIEAAKSFTNSIENAGKVKQTAIDTLRDITQSLEKIALSTDDLNVKDRIIDSLMKIADKVEKADERNHGFFIGMGCIAASIIVSVIARRPVRIA